MPERISLIMEKLLPDFWSVKYEVDGRAVFSKNDFEKGSSIYIGGLIGILIAHREKIYQAVWKNGH